MKTRSFRSTSVARFAGVGALAGVFSTLVFTFIHQLLISPIWFALPAMLLAGALCGACLAWSYALVVPSRSLKAWLKYNLFYLGMFVALGITSLVVFEPVTTIAMLLQNNEPPRQLIGRALPITGLFTLASATLLSILYRPNWQGAGAILVTTAVLVVLLGLNISILGLVAVPHAEAGVLGEVLVLLIALLGAYAAGVAVLGRSHFRSPRRVLNTAVISIGKRRFGVTLALLLAIGGLGVWPVIRAPVEPPAPPLVVNDVSQLNPVRVSEIVVPRLTAEIADAVTRHVGPISIGGARHSMGGQIATNDALFIDMRQFNKILELSSAARTITVQAGATWRQIQEQIDPANLSVKIMQSYANFTVGGSLSVNGHGRYVGLGPLIRSVKSLKVVLADGSVVEASPAERPDVFYGVIGGYGGLGVITEATLELTDNVRLKRTTEVMPIATYQRYFLDRIRGQAAPVFHNANVFPGDYSTVRAVTFSTTDDSVTVKDRLMPLDQSYRLNRLALWIESEWPFGKVIWQHLVDPVYFAGQPVTWRNYEASYDVAELEPASRTKSTYLLQEYFVPVERFDEFVLQMRRVLQTHDVNVVNVSIRHSTQDPGSLLAWARAEVFAFVIYYKQRTDERARTEAGVWTRELIDAALSVAGSYYLPYQLDATEEQFRRAYPRAAEFFALKQRLDPANKFRNELLDKYYHPAATIVR